MNDAPSPPAQLPELNFLENGFAPIPHTFGRLYRRVSGLVEIACIDYIIRHTLGAPPRGGEKPEYCEATIEDFQRYAGCSRGAVLSALAHAQQRGWVASKPAKDRRQRLWKTHPENFRDGPLRMARVVTRKTPQRHASVHSSMPIAAFLPRSTERSTATASGPVVAVPASPASTKSVHSNVPIPISRGTPPPGMMAKSVHSGEPIPYLGALVCANCGVPIAQPECTGDYSCPYLLKNGKKDNVEEDEEGESSSASVSDKDHARKEEHQRRMHERVDDEKTLEYATEKDELVALIKSQGSPCDERLVREICEALELRGVTLTAYLCDVKPRLRRLRLAAGPGFFLHQAQNWSASRPIEPRLKEEIPECCPHCRNGGYLSLNPLRYCACRMGQEVERIERRIQRDQGHGSGDGP